MTRGGVDRAVGRSENLERAISNVVGIICPTAQVEIVLTNLLKSVGAVVVLPGPLAPLISTPLFEWCSTKKPTAGGDLYK